MSKGMEREEVKSKIKTKKRPKCEKMITPEVDVRSKADSKHKLMEKLADTPFFEHIDVWYRCSSWLPMASNLRQWKPNL